MTDLPDGPPPPTDPASDGETAAPPVTDAATTPPHTGIDAVDAALRAVADAVRRGTGDEVAAGENLDRELRRQLGDRPAE